MWLLQSAAEASAARPRAAASSFDRFRSTPATAGRLPASGRLSGLIVSPAPRLQASPRRAVAGKAHLSNHAVTTALIVGVQTSFVVLQT